MSGPFSLELWNNIKTQSTYKTNNFRGIKDETTKTFGVLHSFDEKGNLEKQYYPLTKKSNLVGVKWRDKDKNFSSRGVSDSTCDLFGQEVFRTSPCNSIIIASGELDALSIWQMMSEYSAKSGSKYETTPVVSAIVGESGALKQYQHNYDFLNKFDKIYICPDQDTAGLEALHKVAKVLPKNKLFVIELPKKDANVMLEKGLQQEFISRFFKAKAYSPAGILGSDVLYDKILERALIPKIRFPEFLDPLNRMLAGGIPLGYIVNIMAGSGSRKIYSC